MQLQQAGHLDATLFLLENDAHIGNALYEAAENGHVRIIELLLDFGADIDGKESQGDFLR